jgi:hypothetical protein
MERHDLAELHYITPIANLGSILEHGVLSHRRAQAFNPISVAMQEIQDLRAGRRVPGGLQLHDYANLYICARNPMFFKRLTSRREICVLSLLPTALDLDGVVVTIRMPPQNTFASVQALRAWPSWTTRARLRSTGHIRTT